MHSNRGGNKPESAFTDAEVQAIGRAIQARATLYDRQLAILSNQRYVDMFARGVRWYHAYTPGAIIFLCEACEDRILRKVPLVRSRSMTVIHLSCYIELRALAMAASRERRAAEVVAEELRERLRPLGFGGVLRVMPAVVGRMTSAEDNLRPAPGRGVQVPIERCRCEDDKFDPTCPILEHARRSQ